MTILTAKVGTNAVQFPEILELYVPPPAKILDMTYGKGVFWRNIGTVEEPYPYTVFANDIDDSLGDTSYDYRDLPKMWEKTFNAVVLDPPYMEGNPTPKRGSEIKKAMDDRYKVLNDNAKNVEEILQIRYIPGMEEADRVLLGDGICIVKCQDQVESGKNKWIHIWIYEYATKFLGWKAEDLFVMVCNNKPTMRHNYQIHARKNHSFWWVFRKD